MDKLTDMVGGQVQQYLEGISFPASKDEVVSKLQENGAPQLIVDKLRGVDASLFDSAQDVINKIQG